jgi:hypothetical protein
MTASTIDAIAIDSLVRASLAQPAAEVGITFADPGNTIPFRSGEFDDRLAQIDELFGAAEPAASYASLQG